jgi:hypothetical protein
MWCNAHGLANVSGISRTSIGWALAALAISSGPGSARALQPDSGRAVLASVTDSRGRTVVDLDPDDFVVTEDGDPCDVISVHVADYPIALLLDDLTGSAADLDEIRRVALRFVTRIGHRQVVVGTLTDTAHLIASTDDAADLIARIDRIGPGQGAATPFAATAAAVRAITIDGPPFSAVVVISAGAFEFNEAAVAGVVTTIVESRTMVHVVAQRPPAAAGAAPSDVLRELAQQTRGQYTVIYSRASYQAAMDRLADSLSSELIVEYVAPTAAGGGQLRRSGAGPDVQIGVKRPGVRVSGLGVAR